jgi:hypothetical protein
MKYSLLFGLALVLIHSTADAQHLQNVTPPGFEDGVLSCASFISEQEGWVFAVSPPNNTFNLLYTADGAQTFEKIFELPSDYACYKLQMVDSLFGFAKIENSSAHNDYFWKTSDGGKHWQDITDTSLFNYGQPLWSQRNFYFINHELGFYGASNAIYKTENEGSSWSKTNTPAVIDSNSSNSFRINSVYFTDEKYGWAACSLLMDEGFGMKTVDSGQNWVVCTPVTGDFYSVHFSDSLNGGMVGNGSFSNQIIGTRNNFESIAYYPSEWNQRASVIFYQNDSTIWISGSPPIINRSVNSGQTFEVYDSAFASTHVDELIGDFWIFENSGYALSNLNLLKLDITYPTQISLNAITNPEISISPNPFNQEYKISISALNPESAIFEIYSCSGVLIRNMKKDLVSGKNQISVESQMFEPGMYFLKIKTSQIQLTKKLMKY